MELAFAVKDALLAALAAKAVPGGELDGVGVVDSWPRKGLRERSTVLVLDFEGDEQPATMRGGGGTVDDTFELEVVCAGVKPKTADARVARELARSMSDVVKRTVRESSSGMSVLGVSGVRMPGVRSYRVREFIVGEGRECDVTLRLRFTARIRNAG